MKSSGVDAVESPNTSRSAVGSSTTKCSPSLSTTMARRPAITRSGRSARRSSSRCICVSCAQLGCGSSLSGVACASQLFHEVSAPTRSSARLRKDSSSLSASAAAHCASLKLSGILPSPIDRCPPEGGRRVSGERWPTTSASYSASLSSPSARITLNMSCAATTSLCDSKSPRRAKLKTEKVILLTSTLTHFSSCSGLSLGVTTFLSTLPHSPLRGCCCRALGMICVSSEDTPSLNERFWPVMAFS
mmetsp:Transcript_24158/g.61095  ORF Transcript_24158/g.61095 Transcript_24158/m.61095 type:complete len:246 (+) Transcript_24158:1999-2736(+)